MVGLEKMLLTALELLGCWMNKSLNILVCIHVYEVYIDGRYRYAVDTVRMRKML